MEAELSTLPAVPWLPDPAVSMCRLRPSVPVKLKVMGDVVIWCGVMWLCGDVVMWGCDVMW